MVLADTFDAGDALVERRRRALDCGWRGHSVLQSRQLDSQLVSVLLRLLCKIGIPIYQGQGVAGLWQQNEQSSLPLLSARIQQAPDAVLLLKYDEHQREKRKVAKTAS